MASRSQTEEEMAGILSRYKTVAVVGVSRSPSKASHAVAGYLQSKGYEVVPINPYCDEVLGKKCYRSLLDVPERIAETIEIVDIFRPSEDVSRIVEQAIQLRRRCGKPEVIWMQLGIVDEEAAEAARDAGLTVIMDRCIKIEHSRLESEGRL
ncbi:MAG: CoA-binding protein [Candidatus Bathyarchaeia archaeon]